MTTDYALFDWRAEPVSARIAALKALMVDKNGPRYSQAEVARLFGLTKNAVSGFRTRHYEEIYGGQSKAQINEMARQALKRAQAQAMAEKVDSSGWTEARLTETWEARKRRRAREQQRQGAVQWPR